MLRPYQQEAHDAAIDWMRGSIDPALLDLATGAGKSHVIAAIARTIHDKTGKRVLCLAPSAELVTQNRAKYLEAGYKASMFSASAGGKDLRHPVVFGSPLTVKNRISSFQKQGGAGYALVIVDECHGITPTLRGIIDAMRDANPNLRVLGLTATPYRLGDGYIFRQWPDGKVNTEETSRDPYFMKCLVRVDAMFLIDQGYLTPPVIGSINAEGYDTSKLVANRAGKFDAAAIDQAYHGHGRKTGAIVADVVSKARDRKGVMFFAATVKHAEEIMASLPPELSQIVTGETPKQERATILRRFKSQQIKYLVNVSVLTTGFDAPHVDLIAILRKTESVGLLQQIIGRGLRLDDGKIDCLVLDYTTNLDDHCPDGDLFAPVIKAKKGSDGEGGSVKACCPDCAHENEFSANIQYIEYERDEAGYILDLTGQQVMTDYGPVSGHHGRRCVNYLQTGAQGQYERCGYRWTSKECPECWHPNDIAARYCSECKAEIVDPNEKLVMEFRALKRDPNRLQTDTVISMTCKDGVSQSGNKTIRIEWVTPYRQLTTWVMPEGKHSQAMRDFQMWGEALKGGDDMPATITYKREASGFYRIAAYNRPADTEPEGMIK